METITLDIKKGDRKTGQLAALFIISFLSCAFGGAISTLMSTYLPAVVRDLQGNRSAAELNDIGAYINSIFIFGWAAGGFLWGFAGDRVGRKQATLLAILNFGLFTLLTGFMPAWWGIVVCRFISGFGVGGFMVTAFTLLTEMWPAKTKEIVIGIVSIAFPIGIFSAGIITFIVSSWRQAFYIGIIPAAIALLGYWLMSESEVWIGHRRGDANQATPLKLASGANGKALVSGSIIFGAMLIGMWGIFSWLPTWIQSYFTTDARQKGSLSMMFMGMGGLAGGFFSGWMMKIMGLRISLITCFAVCTLVSFILFKTNASFSNAIFIEIAVLALFFGASQGILSIYIPELFTTNVRSSATGICFNAGRLLTGTAVLFVGVLVTTFGGYANTLFVFSFVFVIGFIAVLLFKPGRRG